MAAFNEDYEPFARSHSAWQSYQQKGIFVVHQFEPGQLVRIDLLEQKIEDVIVEPDQTITGTLVDNTQAIIQVDSAPSQVQIEGWRIGLASTGEWPSPAGGLVHATWRAVVARGKGMSYYFPELLNERNSRYGCPNEYTHIFAKYGRLQVGNTVIFDQLTES